MRTSQEQEYGHIFAIHGILPDQRNTFTSWIAFWIPWTHHLHLHSHTTTIASTCATHFIWRSADILAPVYLNRILRDCCCQCESKQKFLVDGAAL